MAIRIVYTEFKNIGHQVSMRADVNYRYFFDGLGAKVWDNSSIELSEYLMCLSSEKITKGMLDTEEKLIDLSNIVRRFNELNDVEEVTEIGSDKSILQYGDIVIPKIQPRMGNLYVNLNHKRYLGSSELIEYKCDKNKIYPLFLYYLLTTPRFSECLFYAESGKTHRRVTPAELLKYKIPNIPLAVQEISMSKVHPIEQRIKDLKHKIRDTDSIINEVFSKEFCITQEKLIRNTQTCYRVCVSSLASAYDIRMGVRFNSPKFGFLNSNVFQKTYFRDIIDLSQTSLGRQMSPNEIVESSDFYYINANSIRIDGFDENVLTPIKESFYTKHSNITVQKNDIIIIASGEGSIGRSVVFSSDKKCITSQFVMKIHIKNPALVQYVHFYMHSFFFQLLVEKFKKGKGNMMNLFVSQLKDFPIILPNEEKTNRIVMEINKQITEQQNIKNEILRLRNKIDQIIYESLAM